MLNRDNGFYAFESALHVFPAGKKASVMDLETWNDPELWIKAYDDMALGIVFFAEDIIGDQFGIRGREIIRFQAETAQIEPIASSLEEWADLILRDYNDQTGYPIAHKWQIANGALPPGRRLAAGTPFVLGGEFETNNIFQMDAVEGMRFHADVAVQIRHLPDGTKVKFEIVKP